MNALVAGREGDASRRGAIRDTRARRGTVDRAAWIVGVIVNGKISRRDRGPRRATPGSSLVPRTPPTGSFGSARSPEKKLLPARPPRRLRRGRPFEIAWSRPLTHVSRHGAGSYKP